MEELYYLDIKNKSLFVHEHIPEEINYAPFIFLNPIFDEKKRSQKFYAETARGFCKYGVPVIRFDYFGTGDSAGHLYEMRISENLNAIKILIEIFQAKYQANRINLLGLRIGGDLVLELAEEIQENIDTLIVIEPIINGKRYLTEQRARRKLFYKLNKMTNISENLIINGNTYEDHQGYPISEKNSSFLENIQSLDRKIADKNILLVKLNTISSRAFVAQLKEKLEKENNVCYMNFPCSDFWASLEPVDSGKLSDEIVKETMGLQHRVLDASK
jgi:pimeloyl-ACP methyl ester carboxylesterase